MGRKAVVDKLAIDIIGQKRSGPMLIAVTGITASGKSTLANELHEKLISEGLNSIRASIDDFHNHSKIRHNKDKELWRSYYNDAHDYEAMIERLLSPLAHSHKSYQTASLDLDEDVYINPEPLPVTKDLFVVVDGTFLLKSMLNPYWSYRIFVDTSFDAARKRGVARDAHKLGGVEVCDDWYLKRYHKASRYYLEQVKPFEKANAIINNNDIANPELTFKTRESV